MAYAFDTPGDSALRKTLFMNYLIINRSDDDYQEMAAGIYADFDIGFFMDDFVGSDSNLNLFYGYNGDKIDEGEYGFGFHVPAQGVTFLNRELHAFKYIHADFSVTGMPNATDDYFEYLNGFWQDGTPQTYGGDGYGGAILSNYIYSSSPLDPDGWSEFTDGNSPSDRRGLGSFISGDLNAGDSLCFDFALTTAFSYDTLIVDSVYGNFLNRKSVEVLFELTQDVIDFYNSTFSDCAIVYERNPDFVEGILPESFNELKIFPIPATQSIQIQLDEPIQSTDLAITVINSMGEALIQSTGFNGNLLSLDISTLPSGIYFIRITGHSDTITTGEFVKE